VFFYDTVENRLYIIGVVLEGKIGRFFVENTVKDDSQPSKVLRVEMVN
jgi:hypothetical protein